MTYARQSKLEQLLQIRVVRARKTAKLQGGDYDGANGGGGSGEAGGVETPLRVQVAPGPVGMMLGDRLPLAGVTVTAQM